MCSCAVEAKYLLMVAVTREDCLLNLNQEAAEVVRVGGLGQLVSSCVLETR